MVYLGVQLTEQGRTAGSGQPGSYPRRLRSAEDPIQICPWLQWFPTKSRAPPQKVRRRLAAHPRNPRKNTKKKKKRKQAKASHPSPVWAGRRPFCRPFGRLCACGLRTRRGMEHLLPAGRCGQRDRAGGCSCEWSVRRVSVWGPERRLLTCREGRPSS